MDIKLVNRTIQNMGARDLQRAYRATFEIQTLEQVRPLIVERLEFLGVSIPKVETFSNRVEAFKCAS